MKIIVWFTQDLRLNDQPALSAALKDGSEVYCTYIFDPANPEGPQGAARWWLHHSLASLQDGLAGLGLRLRILRGDSAEAIDRLLVETKAAAVFWNCRYEPWAIAQDKAIKAALEGRGVRARSFNAALGREPWEVARDGGQPYKVFTPFWRAGAAMLALPPVREAPASLPKVDNGPHGLSVDALGLTPKPEWDAGFWQRFVPGEAGAREALDAFIDGAAAQYLDERDRPDHAGTSRLSPHLHHGEIAPWRIAHALRDARPGGDTAVEGYVRQLGWREFAYHLLHHFPQTPEQNLNPRFADFAWARVHPGLRDAWRHGRTGVPIVDAGMRELWTTGWMHNRVRMIVGSYLCKHLRYHWREGARWFWDTLVDADLANNTLGWQWIGGTGADAAPYFRIFNPVTQSEKFDPEARFIRLYVPELADVPGRFVHAPWTAGPPAHLGAYPRPIVEHAEARARALAMFGAIRGGAA